MAVDETWFWENSQWATYCPQYDELKRNMESLPSVKVIPDFKSVYEVTLTTTKDDPYELRQWVNKIANSSIYDVVDMPYCIELTKAGLPHIHAILYSSKKYCDGTKLKTLKYPYRYEFKKVRNLDAYDKYIHKEEGNNLIINYCLAKGIPQFDNAKTRDEPKVQEAIS